MNKHNKYQKTVYAVDEASYLIKNWLELRRSNHTSYHTFLSLEVYEISLFLIFPYNIGIHFTNAVDEFGRLPS